MQSGEMLAEEKRLRRRNARGGTMVIMTTLFILDLFVVALGFWV